MIINYTHFSITHIPIGREFGMKASIIIPAYQTERFISETIESVIGQSMGPFDSVQVVVVSDGCDKSFLAASRYSSEISGILLEENSGVYNARNVALSHCLTSSDIVGVIDSDDVWGSGRFLATKRAMKKYPNLTAFTCAFQNIAEDGSLLGTPGRRINAGQLLYTSDIVKRLGMFKPWRCAADTEYLKRAEMIGARYRFVDGAMFYRRRHPNQLTQRPDTGLVSSLRKEYSEAIEVMVASGKEPTFEVYDLPNVAETFGELPPAENTYSKMFKLSAKPS